MGCSPRRVILTASPVSTLIAARLGLLCLACRPAVAAPGELDPTFQGTGWTHVPSGIGGAKAMALQPDGKIVLAGTVELLSAETQMAVWRFHPDGSRDTSFNGTGEVIVTHNSPTAGNALTVRSDGRIIVSGTYMLAIGPPGQFPAQAHGVVVSLLPDGRPDPAFGPGGRGIVETGYFGPLPALTLQPDGKILFAGPTANPPRVGRLLPNGDLDPAFGSEGYAPLGQAAQSLINGALALALQSNGKILAARDEYNCSITRLNPDGSRDTSLISNGTTYLFVPPMGVAACRALMAMPDGKILAAGDCTGNFGYPRGILVTRFLSHGQPDMTFGDGTVPFSILAVEAPEFIFGGMAVQSTGHILIAGTAGTIESPTAYDLVIGRFTPEGRVDTSFGTGGLVRTDLGASRDHARAIALVTDQKLIVAGGYSAVPGAPEELLLARYQVPGTPAGLTVEYPAGTAVRSLDFGAVTAGSRVIVIALRNDGFVPLTNLQAAITGESVPGDFHAGVPAATLAPGAQSTLTVSLTPSSPGPRTASLHITSSTSGISPYVVSLTGSKATPQQIWRVTWFGAPDNSSSGADGNDFDRDGLPNLMEYLTLSNPHTPSPSPLRPLPHTPGTFTYTRPAAALTEFSYQPEAAPSLSGPWSSAGLTSTVLADDGTAQTVQVVSSGGAAVPRLFLRLRMTKL